MPLSIDPRSLGRVRIELHDGDANLDCEVFETWQPIIHELLRCGTTQSFELNRKIGLKRTDTQTLGAAIKASIGVAGISKLESSVKGELKTELTLEEEVSTKRTVTFTSPQCGHFRALQYQAIRTYKLEYRDTRFLHRDSWSQTLTEYTSEFSDASKRVEFDPDCGCKHKTGLEYDGLLQMVIGNVAKLVGFRDGDDGLLLDLDAHTVRVRMAPSESRRVRIRAEWLSESIIFLLNQPSVEVFEATFSPCEDEEPRSDLINDFEEMIDDIRDDPESEAMADFDEVDATK